MLYEKTIKIEAFMPATADKKAAQIQTIANTLDEDVLKIICEMCAKKGNSINESFRSNENIIRNHF